MCDIQPPSKIQQAMSVWNMRRPLTASPDSTKQTVQCVHVDSANQSELMHDSNQKYAHDSFIPHHID